MYQWRLLFSDHRPISIDTNLTLQAARLRNSYHFQFNHNWILEEDYSEVLKNSWETAKMNDNIHGALNYCSVVIKKWASTNVGSISR